MVNVNCKTFTLLYIARQNEDAPRKKPLQDNAAKTARSTPKHTDLMDGFSPTKLIVLVEIFFPYTPFSVNSP